MSLRLLAKFLFLLLLAAGGLAQASPAGWGQWGKIESLPGKGCVVLSAPHGTFDQHTDEIAREAARRTGFATVIATGFIERHPFETRPHRINVNRPTEGARKNYSEESHTERARTVFAEYARRVHSQLRGRSPVLYVEVHGYSWDTAVEVAVKGIGREDALALKRIWEEERRAGGEEGRLFEGIQIRVEPADAIRYRATASKRVGVISQVERALHFELPRRMRFENAPRAAAARLLARVLPRFHAERLGACRTGD